MYPIIRLLEIVIYKFQNQISLFILTIIVSLNFVMQITN
jgi:hypothetical protein